MMSELEQFWQSMNWVRENTKKTIWLHLSWLTIDVIIVLLFCATTD